MYPQSITVKILFLETVISFQIGAAFLLHGVHTIHRNSNGISNGNSINQAYFRLNSDTIHQISPTTITLPFISQTSLVTRYKHQKVHSLVADTQNDVLDQTQTTTTTAAAAADAAESQHQQKRSTLSASWQRRYEQLKSFQEEHGHCNVPSKEKGIGNWVQKQRSAYKLYVAVEEAVAVAMEAASSTTTTSSTTSTTTTTTANDKSNEESNNRKYRNIYSNSNTQAPLTKDQVQLLNDIDFIWNVREWKYQQSLNSLERFYEKYGHIDLPTSKTNTNNVSPDELGKYRILNKWLSRQKEEYRKFLNGNNNECNLTDDRRHVLEKLGFHIGMFDIDAESNTYKETRSFIRASWDSRFEELLEFKTIHGHCIVPTAGKESTQLSGWVQHQRAEKKKKLKGVESRLSDEKEQRLDEIGFIWSIQDNVWKQRLNELKEFKTKHGHIRVHTKDGQMGNWVMIQRLQYGLKQKGEKNTLSDERMEALNELGFEWDIHEISWKEKFNELKERIKDKNEEESVALKEAPHILSWVATQRAEMRYKQQGLHSNLTNEREEKLNAIGFDWKVDEERKKQREAIWMTNFEKLQEYQTKHSTCRVPIRKTQCSEEKKFSHWVRDQRRYYKAFVQGLDAPMTIERQELLESMGFADDITM